MIKILAATAMCAVIAYAVWFERQPIERRRAINDCILLGSGLFFAVLMLLMIAGGIVWLIVGGVLDLMEAL